MVGRQRHSGFKCPLNNVSKKRFYSETKNKDFAL